MSLARALLAALACLCLGAVSPSDATLIRGARVFDGSGRAAAVRDVLIRGDRIAAVGRNLRLPRGATLVEARGQTLIPGLHDLHIHTGRPVFADKAALAAGFAPYLRHGVTSVNEYSVSGPMLAGIRALEPGTPVPHLELAIRMGVPDGHGTESDYTNSITTQVTTPAEARAAMAQALPYGPDLIKVFADGWRYGRDEDRPSMDVATLSAITKAARRARIPVVTHTVTLAGAKIAARARVTALVHGIGDAPADAELILLMKRGRTAYVPTLVVYEPQATRTFLPAEWDRLSDTARAREERRRAAPARPVTEIEARRWAIMQDNVRRLKAAGIPIGIGTDTGIGGVYPGSAALREIVWLTRLGFTPAEALKAATSVSARIIGRKRGRIARGLPADLVLIEGQPDERIEDLYEVRRVWVGGHEITL